jgi:hypothetical protein
MTDSPIQQTELREQIKSIRHFIGKYRGVPQYSDPLGDYLEEDELDQIVDITAQAVLSAQIEECKSLLIGSLDYDDFVRRVTQRLAKLESTTSNLKGDK